MLKVYSIGSPKIKKEPSGILEQESEIKNVFFSLCILLSVYEETATGKDKRLNQQKIKERKKSKINAIDDIANIYSYE